MASVIKVDTIKSLTGNEAITISESGVPQLNVPAFRALATADQAVTSGTVTQVNLPNVQFDTNGWFSTSTYRYTPQIAGYYFFRGLLAANGTSMTTVNSYIRKNGNPYSLTTSRLATSTNQYIEVSTIVYLNGSTDYVDHAGLVGASSGAEFFVSPGNETWATSTLEGFLVRAA